MLGREAVLVTLGEIHANQDFYHLVAADTPGANELWQNIGVLHMRLMGGSPPTAGQTAERIRRLKANCTGPLAQFEGAFDAALDAAISDDW